MEEVKTEQDPLVDEPIKTYEEFREDFAKEIRQSPSAVLFKAAVDFVRYLFTREALMIALLVDKEIITPEEANTYFGPEVHKQTQAEGVKALKNYLLGAAAAGKIVDPNTGKQINPDDILVYTDDVFDLEDRGWSGRTLETISEQFGKSNVIREAYDKYVSDTKAANTIRARRRRKRDEAAQARENEQVDRVRQLRIYLSKCNIADKPPPTEEEAQKMLDGTLPIPESA